MKSCQFTSCFVTSLLFMIFTGTAVLAQSNLSFAPALTYGSGGYGAASVALGDVNRDGKPDLIVANLDGTVSVLLGNGDATFQSAVTYSSGGQSAFSVAVGNLTGNGNLDIVVANSVGVSVLLGNGDGTFQAAVNYGSGGPSADAVAVADVNRDGKPDIVVAGRCVETTYCNNSVGVLLGNGDGTFQTAVTYSSDGKYGAIFVAIADVNADGKPDLLLANDSDTNNTVGVLLGNGDGTFQPAVTYEAGGVFDMWLSVGDVNGDGKPDLVVTNACDAPVNGCFFGTVVVLLGNGDGSFQTGTTYDSSEPGLLLPVAVADVNGDGKPDVIVANYSNVDGEGTVSVLLGNGDGTFQEAVSYSSGGPSADAEAVADVNGDGKPDVVVADTCSNTNCNTGLVDVLKNTEEATYRTILSAVTEDVSNRLSADIMILTLKFARDAATKGDKVAADFLLRVFIDEVKGAQRDKLVTAANAATLTLEANSLMM